jgi:dTDP-glucose 4,6-dehydratase
MAKTPPRRRNSSPPVSVVTGGAGFLGSHLIDLLLSKGHQVVAIDNLVTGDRKSVV